MKLLLQKYWMLIFFVTYAALMLYEGVITQLSFTNAQWVPLFAIGALVTYWAHKRNGIITIALLFTHTTLELIHHGNELATITIAAGIVMFIHFLFDCGFLWNELRNHTKSPKSVFSTIVIFYIIAFGSSALLGNHISGIAEGVEGFTSAIAGGIFACVVAHTTIIIKKLHK